MDVSIVKFFTPVVTWVDNTPITWKNRLGAIVDETAADAAVKLHFETLGTPVALACWLMYKYREYGQLCNVSFDPVYHSPDDYCAIELVRKVPFRHADLTPEDTAVEAFRAAEEKCRETNAFLRASLNTAGNLNGLLHIASNLIADVLESRPFSFHEWMVSCRYGKKAAVGSSGLDAHTCAHLANATVAKGCEALVDLYISQCARSTNSAPDDTNVVRGSNIGFVPKNAKTHRSIAVEPTLNMYFQRGLGIKIQRRLLEVLQIDLQDQSKNQRLALKGSKNGTWATIDLSSASDLIAYELVRQLLPPFWWAACLSCRTREGTMRWGSGKELNVVFEKFSSMGNGYTFPLQTLIFWAISKAAMLRAGVPGRVLVYGDDIIVPSAAFSTVTGALESVGFKVNTRKSYASGPFRESCGMYAFAGESVRATKLQGLPTKSRDWVGYANSVLAQAVEEGGGHVAASRWRRLHNYCVAQAQASSRVKVPTIPPISFKAGDGHVRKGNEYHLVPIPDNVVYLIGATTRTVHALTGMPDYVQVTYVRWDLPVDHWEFERTPTLAGGVRIGGYILGPIDVAPPPKGVTVCDRSRCDTRDRWIAHPTKLDELTCNECPGLPPIKGRYLRLDEGKRAMRYALYLLSTRDPYHVKTQAVQRLAERLHRFAVHRGNPVCGEGCTDEGDLFHKLLFDREAMGGGGVEMYSVRAAEMRHPPKLVSYIRRGDLMVSLRWG